MTVLFPQRRERRRDRASSMLLSLMIFEFMGHIYVYMFYRETFCTKISEIQEKKNSKKFGI